MRGNTKITRIPTTISRKVRPPNTVKGIPGEIHSLSPSDRIKNTIHYLKNTPPATPVLQYSSITASKASISPFHENSFPTLNFPKPKPHSRLRSNKSMRSKLARIEDSCFPDKKTPKKLEDTEQKPPYSLDYFSDFRPLLINFKVPVFRDRSCLLMSKEEYEHKLPKSKYFQVLRRRKNSNLLII